MAVGAYSHMTRGAWRQFKRKPTTRR